MNKPSEKRQVTVMVNAIVHARMQALAKTAGVSLTAYATMLLDAAYAARCKATGDVDLDIAVGRVALLFGTGFDVASIREATGLSEAFVGQTIAAWQDEMKRGCSPAEMRVTRHA